MINLTTVNLDRLFSEIEEEVRWAEEALEEFRERIARHEQLYLGQPKQKVKNFPWEKASNLVVPLVGTFVDAIFARHHNTLFNVPKIWFVEYFNEAWKDAAPLWREFIEFDSVRTWKLHSVATDWINQAVKHGLGVIRVPWEQRLRKATVFNPTSGGEMDEVYEAHVGPAPHFIPLARCLWPSDATSVESARWFGRKYWVAKRRFELGMKLGFYSNGEDYLKTVRRIERTAEEEAKDTAAGTQAPVMPEGVELYEISWLLDIDGDGVEEEIILVFNPAVRKFARAIYHPYWHGRRYFIGIPYWPLEGRVEGLGLCGMLEQLEEAISTVHNQATDNATVANTRIWAARPGNPQIRPGMKLYPGKVVLLDDPANDLIPKQLGEIYPSIVEREAILRDYAERRAGVTDYSLGRESPVVGWRATATSTLSLLQEAARRFDLPLRNIRVGFNELALQATELYQQFRPVRKLAAFFGDRLPMVLAFMTQPPTRVRDGMDINLQATTATKNIVQERESFVQLFTLITQYYQMVVQATTAITNPQVPALTRAAVVAAAEKGSELIKRILEAWPVPDPRTFLLRSEELMEVVNALQQTALPPGRGGVAPRGGGVSPAPPVGGPSGLPAAGAGPVP